MENRMALELKRYPQVLPTQEAKVVLDFLRGQPGADRQAAAEAGWWVMGYGLSKLPMGTGTITFAGTEDEAATSLEEHLQSLADAHEKPEPEVKTFGAGGFWLILVQTLLPLLLKKLQQ
jgi:hypothetical protein